MISKGSCDTED